VVFISQFRVLLGSFSHLLTHMHLFEARHLGRYLNKNSTTIDVTLWMLT
jgi:hypothetical protein